MITIKSEEEIRKLKKAGNILSEILRKLKLEIKPGISTGHLDTLAERLITEYGCKPSFKGYKSSDSNRPYPAVLCASLNEVIVHQLPNTTVILKEGDIISLDLGLWYSEKGSRDLCVDAAFTVGVGKISKIAENLIKTTKEALEVAITKIIPGGHLGDIGSAIENYVVKRGFYVIKELVGHGVGYKVHEEPEILNFGMEKTGPVLKPGMVLAIEPMVSVGNSRVIKFTDGFGYKTADNSLSAHFEATVAVTARGCEILTSLI